VTIHASSASEDPRILELSATAVYYERCFPVPHINKHICLHN